MYQVLSITLTTILFSSLLISTIMIYDIPQQKQQAMAQNNNNNNTKVTTTPSNSVSNGITKQLIDDAIQTLTNNQPNRALVRLNLAHENLAANMKGNSSNSNNTTSLTQTTKVLVDDAIQDLNQKNTNRALVHLNLAHEN